MPFRSDWSQSRGDVRTDFLHAILSNAATIEIARAAAMTGVAYVGMALAERMGLALWPSSWPVAAQVVLALVIAEFPAYWWHRTLHRSPTMWRVHTVHHSAERLYWLNGARAHPLEAVGLFLVMEAPLVFLGAGVEIFAFVAVFFTSLGLLQHSNVDHHCGPLSWVIATAEVHRWHHSVKLDEGNRNFAFNLVIWDQIFGSFILPNRHGPEVVGIEDLEAYPKGYIDQLLAPFRAEDPGAAAVGQSVASENRPSATG